MREPEPRAKRGRETEIESFLWQEERGCGSRSNAGLLKKDMIRIERENVGEAEKRTGTEASFFSSVWICECVAYSSEVCTPAQCQLFNKPLSCKFLVNGPF